MSEKVQAAGAEGAKPWYKNKLWYFFNSLKLTLFVLITLAIVSIFGTVIEQNQYAEFYATEYGEKWASVILKLDLNDMYHSYWFLALLAMLALNIIVCTFERFPPKWKSLLNHKSDFDPSIVDRFSNNRVVNPADGLQAAKDRVEAALKFGKFKFETRQKGSEYIIYAWKGMMGRLGSDIVHISLLLILLGAIIGSLYGYKDFKTVYVGDTMTVPDADFELRLDKFWIDYYETGQIRQYNSNLTVVENGKDILTKQIWVNEPLYYKGIRFYQSSYGQAWNKVEEARIGFMKKGSGSSDTVVEVKWDQESQIPGTDYTVKVVGYVCDFAYDEKTNKIFAKSPEPENPALLVELYKGGTLIAKPWLFLKYPAVFPSIPNSEDNLVFEAYRTTMYSGISINKDPGTNVVWFGTAVMGIGFIFSFFVYHRRIWIRIKDNNGSVEVKAGGTINKNNLVFEKEIDEIAEAAKGPTGGRK